MIPVSCLLKIPAHLSVITGNSLPLHILAPSFLRKQESTINRKYHVPDFLLFLELEHHVHDGGLVHLFE